MSNPIEEALELDKKETFGTETKEEKTETKTEVKTEEKTEAKTEAKKEEKTEGTETKQEEKKEDPWWKSDFEDEDKLKEFVNTAKTKTNEVVKPKFANTNAEAYNNWVENGGIDDFSIFQDVNKFSVSEKPTSDEMVKALVLKQVLDDPEYKGKEGLLEKRIRKEYKLNLLGEDAEFASDEEKEEAELKLIDLKKEFKKTATHFQELQEKSKPKVDETLQTRLKEGPAKLKEHLDNQTKDFKINIPEIIKGEKGEEKFGENSIFSITFDEAMVAEYKEKYSDIAKGRQYPDLTDGSHKEIQAVAAALVLGNHLHKWGNDLFNAGFAKGSQKSIEDEIKSKNPSAVGKHETKTTNTTKDDRSDEIFK